MITVSRFFLGAGVGGKYPLAGTVSAEDKADPDSDTDTGAQAQSRAGASNDLAAPIKTEEPLSPLPLAATAGVVAVTAKPTRKSALRIALGFFWQTPGSMLPYALGMTSVFTIQYNS